MQLAFGKTPNELLQEYNTYAYFSVPTLRQNQVAELLKGNVVKIIDHDPEGKKPSRAVGYMISEISKSDLWLAAQDPHFTVQSSTTEFLLYQDPSVPDKMQWYGYLDAPWPITDRYWVVLSWNNHKVSVKSNNRFWEHPWELVSDGPAISRKKMDANIITKGSKSQLDSAIYTPYNQGGWGMLSISDTSIKGKTLIIYHAKTVVGGGIPENLILQLTYSGIDGLLQDLEDRARNRVPKHYVSGHKAIYGGDGKVVQTR
jgi:hypothetical protein